MLLTLSLTAAACPTAATTTMIYTRVMMPPITQQMMPITNPMMLRILDMLALLRASSYLRVVQAESTCT